VFTFAALAFDVSTDMSLVPRSSRNDRAAYCRAPAIGTHVASTCRNYG
jgi:hypothetical protein